MSLQSKSGGGEGIHTSGYAGSQLVLGVVVGVGEGLVAVVGLGLAPDDDWLFERLPRRKSQGITGLD